MRRSPVLRTHASGKSSLLKRSASRSARSLLRISASLRLPLRSREALSAQAIRLQPTSLWTAPAIYLQHRYVVLLRPADVVLHRSSANLPVRFLKGSIVAGDASMPLLVLERTALAAHE